MKANTLAVIARRSSHWPRSTSSEISSAACYPSRCFPRSVCVSSEVQSAVRHTRAAEMILHELPGGHSAAGTRTAGVGVGAASRPTWCLQTSFLGEADCVQAGPLEKPKAMPSVGACDPSALCKSTGQGFHSVVLISQQKCCLFGNHFITCGSPGLTSHR